MIHIASDISDLLVLPASSVTAKNLGLADNTNKNWTGLHVVLNGTVVSELSEGPRQPPPPLRINTCFEGRIIGRLEAGQTQTEVSRALNVAQSVICRLWRLFEDTGDVRRMPVQGRQWVTTPQEDRYFILTARRNRTMPARQLSSELAAASGVRVSRQTVYRRLRAGGLCARRPAVCVQLTRVHIRNRLQWSRQHQHWTLHEWRNVLFTDESRCSLTNDSRRTKIWRERGTRFHPKSWKNAHLVLVAYSCGRA
ncbi:hypothetical protein ANN_19340 [Periplaneta americana]|uniref:Transposase Tc1-like domain-containing protein n=1 Tax=Periplaneta americana TaxID=6978 RepID=A0ABQ8S9P5_PERAM|nr:hypothetical protein ANN_19340 [Periplaneta americana]